MEQHNQPEAIIYIPGLTQQRDKDKSIESFAYRMQKAIDVNSSDGLYKYGMEMQKRGFGKDNKLECKTASIFRIDQDKKIPVYDIYELDYNKELTGKFENLNVMVKTFWLFYALISKFPRIVYTLLNFTIKGISVRDKAQAFMVGFVLFCLSAYGVVLVSSLLVAVGSKLNFSNIPDISEVVYFPDFRMYDFFVPLYDLGSQIANKVYMIFYTIIINIKNIVVAYKQYIISSAAAILLLLPDFKNFVTSMATDYLCLINYFNIGDRRLTIIGKFEELLEHVVEQDNKYEKINVYAYSYGSIIALDTLFPYDGRTSERIKTKINTLVTIGCPFDFTRVYWPDYYSKRKKSAIHLEAWYNIYSSIDVLSSNFRNDNQEKDAEISLTEGGILPINVPYNVISPDNVNFMHMVMLLGLRAHTMYWDDTEYSASCFNNLFQEMKDRFSKERLNADQNKLSVELK